MNPLLLPLLLLQAPSPAPWRPVAVSSLGGPAQAQVAQAQAAKGKLAQALMGRLQAEMKAHGPAAAVEVCRSEAPLLAAEVGRSEGLRIGRTSDRLRNPANTGPEWAQPLLATRPAEATFALGPKGELGAILPIRLQASCLACHGESAKLAPGVVDALRKAYPKDQATGYHEGDLRGWFWVEVPAKSPSQNPTQH